MGQSGLFEEDGGNGSSGPVSAEKWPATLPKKEGGRYVYPDEFDRAFALYPERAGPNPKLGAYKAARTLVKGRVAPKVLIDTAGNYATWARKSRIVGRRAVMQAKTFWGPEEPFREYVDGMPKVDVEERNGAGGEDPDEFVAREKERRRRLLEGAGTGGDR